MIDQHVDALIFCALDKEFEALERALSEIAPRMWRERIGPRAYQLRTISGQEAGMEITVAVTCVGAMGRVPAAIAATHAVYDFQVFPRYVILCGIAAADPDSRYQLGDVMLPQVIIDYAEQKRSNGQMTLRSRQFPLRGPLHSAAVAFSASDWFRAVPELTVRYVKELHADLRLPSTAHEQLSLACGDVVLNDKPLVREILEKLSASQSLAALAVEMESTGIARAIEGVHGRAPEFLVVKAVSDFAYDKRDSAQPFARDTAAYFVAGFLRHLASSKSVAFRETQNEESAVIAELGPSDILRTMLASYPTEVAEKWKRTAIDGAFEVFRCPRQGNAYGGLSNQDIKCDTRARDWPEAFGGLSPEQRRTLMIGLAGSEELGIEAWLKDEMKAPRPIRVLAAPARLPSHAPALHLRFGNSDYLTARAITQLSRIERETGKLHLGSVFPERWPAHREPGGVAEFTTQCVPYHISAQAIIVCESGDGERHVLLAKVNPQRDAIATGWGATMAAQMWGQDRAGNVEQWWTGPATDKLLRRDPQSGDDDLEATLYRGIMAEFEIDIRSELRHEPMLLLAAIEQDMYFMTFIYVVRVPLSLAEVYRRWETAPEHHHNGLLVAYQLTGSDENGVDLNGPRRLAALLARDYFDAGPHARPIPRPAGEITGPWHVSSRLRLYALGMHFWPHEFRRLVTIR